MSAEASRDAGHIPQGTWSIDESQIGEIARREVRDVPGVVGVTEAGPMDRLSGQVGLLRRILPRGPAAIHGGQVHLKLSFIAEYGRVLPDLVEEVRERAARAVEGMTGYRVAAVDVTVANLHVPGDPLPTREPGGEAGRGGGRVDF